MIGVTDNKVVREDLVEAKQVLSALSLGRIFGSNVSLHFPVCLLECRRGGFSVVDYSF